MDKRLYVLLALVLGFGFYIIWKDIRVPEVPPCIPVEIQVVQAIQVSCADIVVANGLQEEVCKDLGKDADCVLEPMDRFVALPRLNSEVNDCAINFLKHKNRCTDSVKDIVK